MSRSRRDPWLAGLGAKPTRSREHRPAVICVESNEKRAVLAAPMGVSGSTPEDVTDRRSSVLKISNEESITFHVHALQTHKAAVIAGKLRASGSPSHSRKQ